MVHVHVGGDSARLRDASTSIRALLASGSPHFEFMNTPKTAEIYWTRTLVDPWTRVDGSIEGDDSDNSKPKANFQKIRECRLGPLSEIAATLL